MIIICPKCKARLALPDERLKAGGTKFKCGKCGTSLLFKKTGGNKAEDSSSETMSLPSSQPSKEPASARIFKEDQKQPETVNEAPPGVKISGDIRSSPVSTAGTKQDKQPETQKKTETSPDTLTALPPKEIKGMHMRVIVAGTFGIIVLVLAAIFFFRPMEKMPQEQAKLPAQDTVASGAQSPAAGSVSQEIGGENTQGGSAVHADSPEQPFRAIPFSEMNEAKAIEIVKKSDALLKNTPVDEIIRAWTTQNAGQYKVVGWQAKKIDETKYLVSYTALDDKLTKGFYFDLDVETGVVQDLAHNPQLQKKYSIQYSQ